MIDGAVHLGFTGSRHGLTGPQADVLRSVLASLIGEQITVLHHGDCVGADAQGAEIARELGYFLEAHPPGDSRLRAYSPACVTHEPLGYLERDQAIVALSEALVAAPATLAEQSRSGTWFTVRRAREAGLPVIVVTPDGVGTLD